MVGLKISDDLILETKKKYRTQWNSYGNLTNSTRVDKGVLACAHGWEECRVLATLWGKHLHLASGAVSAMSVQGQGRAPTFAGVWRSRSGSDTTASPMKTRKGVV